MIRMAETASAVCLHDGCFWTASGPNSMQAALAHDEEKPDHVIWLSSGMGGRPADVEARGGNLGRWGRGETMAPEPGNIPEFSGASDLGEVCNSMDIDMCSVHGVGTPWRREWNRLHPEDGPRG